ncbi:hypothetical protein J6T66_05265 [bacterium]|nr:hypothetical protein [bacterium]
MDREETIDCFTLSKSHLNHDINQTERKKTTTIDIKTRATFKNVLPADFFIFLVGIDFLGEERLEALNSLFLDITLKIKNE